MIIIKNMTTAYTIFAICGLLILVELIPSHIAAGWMLTMYYKFDKFYKPKTIDKNAKFGFRGKTYKAKAISFDNKFVFFASGDEICGVAFIKNNQIKGVTMLNPQKYSKMILELVEKHEGEI